MKMRFLTIASFTALLSTSANALPRPDGSVVARSAEPEDIVAAIAESANLHARGLDLRIGANPSGDAHCPATDRYGAHTFTSNQIMVAFMAGAKLSAEGKQVGANNYPHAYNSNQQLPNGCGTKTQEFPIVTNNQPYVGDAVTTIPDRVLYEAKQSGNDLLVKYCGVIRHGNGSGFDNCP